MPKQIAGLPQWVLCPLRPESLAALVEHCCFDWCNWIRAAWRFELLGARLAITAVLATLLQLTIVAASNYFDNDGLLVAFVHLETNELARRVVFSGDGPIFDAKSQPQHYRGSNADGYAYRIFDSDGQVVAEHNGSMLLALSPWQSHPSGNEDLWLRNLDQHKRLFVAGGLRERSGANEIWVEVMTTGDPAHRFLSILSYEILDEYGCL